MTPALIAVAQREAGRPVGRLMRELLAAHQRLVDGAPRARWLIRADRALSLGFGLAPHAEVRDARGMALVLPSWADTREAPEDPLELVDLLYLDPAPAPDGAHAWWWAAGQGAWLGLPPLAPEADAPPAVLRLHATPAAWAIGNSLVIHRWQQLYAERLAEAERRLDRTFRDGAPRFTLQQLGMAPADHHSVGRMWLANPAAAPWSRWIAARVGKVVCDSDAQARALWRVLTPSARRKLAVEVALG